ncbi:MAG: CHAT domain-containing protein, partial [Candidatus Eremiobacterota bacterium]
AQRGDLPGAETALRQGLTQLDTWLVESSATPQGKREFLSRSQWFFDLLMDVLARQGRGAEAMEVGQHIQMQTDRASLDLTRVDGRTPEVTRTLRDLESKREEAEALRSQVQAAESAGDVQTAEKLKQRLAGNTREFHQTLATLRQQDPELERLVAVRPSSFSKLQPHLPEGTLLVGYYPGPDKLFVFTATRKDLKIYGVNVGRKALERDVTAVRRAIINSARNSQPLDAQSQALLASLYDSLLGPLEGDLSGIDTVAVVPSGMLYYLPFAALTRNGRYLVEQRAVVLLSSLEVLELVQGKQTGKPDNLLALANPDGSLPGAAAEVQKLAPLFARSQIFYTRDATKQRIQKPGAASVVHLATHGVLDARDVNQSYLVMAGSEKLTTGEIYGLDLSQVSLVTLSACQTGLGERQPGAEVANLAQAFSVAGSKSMLASLWKVDDEATAELMVHFYRELMAGKNKAEALRQAQLKLIADPRRNHPFQWASFELIGDWR